MAGGQSLGANKVIHCPGGHPPEGTAGNIPEPFLLLSPANPGHMTSVVNHEQRGIIKKLYDSGRGRARLPFDLSGWLPCIADTGRDRVFSGILDNVHTKADEDCPQPAHIAYTGALLTGTYDTFTDGNTAAFLQNINDHVPTAARTKLFFVPETGHAYQGKEQETAATILNLMRSWYS